MVDGWLCHPLNKLSAAAGEISPQPQSSLLALGAHSPLVSIDSFTSFRLRRQRTALTFSSLPMRPTALVEMTSGISDVPDMLRFRSWRRESYRNIEAEQSV